MRLVPKNKIAIKVRVEHDVHGRPMQIYKLIHRASNKYSKKPEEVSKEETQGKEA